MWEDIERDRQWEVNLQRKDRMKPPDVVPDAVIDSIAKSHVKYERQGECPHHDRRWQGRYCSRWDSSKAIDEVAVLPCTCAVKMGRFEDILKELRWSYDHYSFNYVGMYVGVELDGYMHT